MGEHNCGLYIILISVHGLIRANDLELGKDADTGGQTKYVLELATALAQQPTVAKVELVTRLISADNVDPDYANPIESVCEKLDIVRIPCGPDSYLPKEQLWDYLDIFTDNLFDHLKAQERMPDLLHSHYADAGYVATRIKHLLPIPLAHTGHSLGNDKKQRLIASGMSASAVEEKYNISRRIEAEEDVLANANLVVASTNHEIEQQYETYDFYQPQFMQVIPPGTDLAQFHPPELGEQPTKVLKSIRRFLDDPSKPIILALSRPDHRKNIRSLVHAFGNDKTLQEHANLVIIAGNRDDIRQMDEGAQDVLSELLILIDYYDIYGKVALPKKHLSSEVPVIYRYVAASRGVFVNPALTEPFGLTLLEAAASGLPFVATENGGPVDIAKNCECGELVDPLSATGIASALKTLLLDGEKWRTYSSNGIRNIVKKYSWEAHAQKYLKVLEPIIQSHDQIVVPTAIQKASRKVNKLIISDLDKTLLSDTQGLKQFAELIRKNRKTTAFGIATARTLDSVLSMIKQYNLPLPDILISSLGTQIYYSKDLNKSADWDNHVDHNWNPKSIRRLLQDIPGLTLQDPERQSVFKISYDLNSSVEGAPELSDIVSLLRQQDQSVNVWLSASKKLDIIPARASKGLALRYVAHTWNIPLDNILVAGGGSTDEDLLSGNTLGVVVANRQHEAFSDDFDTSQVYLSKEPNALGILDAIKHYDFFEETSDKQEQSA